MKCIRVFAAALVVGAVLVGGMSAVFAGSTWTYGDYTSGAITWFNDNPRYVLDPSQPGPEVAFYLDSASTGLMLGTSYCGSTYDGPLYYQFQNNWNAVAYFGSPRKFCVVSYGDGYTGDFDGTIAWD